jgi:hypothetical protein
VFHPTKPHTVSFAGTDLTLVEPRPHGIALVDALLQAIRSTGTTPAPAPLDGLVGAVTSGSSFAETIRALNSWAETATDKDFPEGGQVWNETEGTVTSNELSAIGAPQPSVARAVLAGGFLPTGSAGLNSVQRFKLLLHRSGDTPSNAAALAVASLIAAAAQVRVTVANASAAVGTGVPTHRPGQRGDPPRSTGRASRSDRPARGGLPGRSTVRLS